MFKKEKIKTGGFKRSFLVNLTVLLLFISLGLGFYIFYMTELESWKLDEFRLKSGFLFEEIANKNLLSNGSFKSVAGISFSDFAKENDIVYCVVTNNSDKILKEFSINEVEKIPYLSSTLQGSFDYESSIFSIKYAVDNKGKGYFLYLGLNGKDYQEFIIHKSTLITPYVSGILLLGFLIIYLINKIFVSSPVNKIAVAAQQMANENLSYRARYYKNNELGIIAGTLNFLANNLDKANNQLSDLNKELKTIVNDKIGELNLEVNQRRLAEHRLRQSEEQFRLMFERAPIGMVIMSLDGKIIKSNSAFCDTLGYSSDEIEGKYISEITVEEYNNYDKKLHSALLTGKLSHVYFEKELRKKDGLNIHAIVESVLTRDGNNNPHHIIQQVIDITERKKVEKELIISKERAEESDRLKSAFLAQMSHEIRTPLNVILTATPLLAEDLSSGDEDINVLLESVSSAGKRLQRTIDMILNLSSVQSGNYMVQFEAINLNEDLKSLVDEMRSLAMEKNLDLTLTNNVYEPLIRGDKYTLNQIFQNLLGNSIKYTQSGKIEVKITEDNPGKINVEVKDTGIGMSEEYMKKLFTPFSQEDMGYKREFEGNGLGLALVKKYVELNKARIFVSSKKNKGTVFKIVFNKLAEKIPLSTKSNKIKTIS
jgi:PAS domain S-box-containing protein